MMASAATDIVIRQRRDLVTHVSYPAGLVRTVALWALLTVSTSIRANGADLVTFDLTKAHGFSGYGAQIWNRSSQLDPLQDLLRDLKLRFVRMSVPGHADPSQLQSGVAARTILGAFAANASPDERRSLVDLGRRLGALDIRAHVIIWEMPRPWRFETKVVRNGKDATAFLADPVHTHDYANFVTAEVLYAKQAGIPVDMAELTNEPDGDWNTRWTPEQYADLVVAARQALDENGLSQVGIEGPGTSTQRTAGPYLEAVGRSVVRKMTAISVHDWDTRGGRDPIGLSEAFAKNLDAVHSGLPLNVTEFNDDALRWLNRDNLVNGHQVFSTEDRGYAVGLAAEALKLAGDGASEALVWEAQDQLWEKSWRGLLDKHGERKPAATALATFMALIPPRSKAVSGLAAEEGVVATFESEDTLVIGLANLEPRNYSAEVRFHGLGAHSLRLLVHHEYLASNSAGVQAEPPPVAIEFQTIRFELRPLSVAAISIAKG